MSRLSQRQSAQAISKRYTVDTISGSRTEKLQRLQLERQKIMEKDHEVGGDSGALGGLRLPGSPGSPLREEGKKSPQSPSILNALGGADMVEKVSADLTLPYLPLPRR